MSKPTLSIAIPIYNEESVLPELYRRLAGVLADLPGWSAEIIFVDDGSSDGSVEVLEAIAGIDGRVRVVTLSRNFGHQAALTAALDHVSGDVVVVMDGDLQDAPETIPRFLAQYEQGFDVVYAVRTDRKEGWLLRSCYAAFYRLIGLLAELDLPRGAGDFALMSRRVVQQLRASPERRRYLRGLRSWVGFRQKGIPVERAARHAGRSKYSAGKLLRLACDGIFSFSIVPLRAAALLGGVVVGVSGLAGAYCLCKALFLGSPPAGSAWLALAVLFSSGAQLLFLGLLGEYVGRIHQEVKQRPHYVVDRIIPADEHPFPTPVAGTRSVITFDWPSPRDEQAADEPCRQ